MAYQHRPTSSVVSHPPTPTHTQRQTPTLTPTHTDRATDTQAHIHPHAPYWVRVRRPGLLRAEAWAQAQLARAGTEAGWPLGALPRPPTPRAPTALRSTADPPAPAPLLLLLLLVLLLRPRARDGRAAGWSGQARAPRPHREASVGRPQGRRRRCRCRYGWRQGRRGQGSRGCSAYCLSRS
jgi:hypothetical protein